MQKIYKKYQGVAIEDDLAYVSKEFKQFASYFKRRLKMNLEDRGMNLVEFHVGHYDFGGFAEKDGKYVYFSYNCPRYGTPINFEKTDCMEGFLYRTAKSEKDYTGGRNHFTNLLQLVPEIERLIQAETRNAV